MFTFFERMIKMRETMIYDTDVYQIRKDILKRMLEIIDNRKKVSTVFYGDSITKYMDIDHYFSFEAHQGPRRYLRGADPRRKAGAGSGVTDYRR